MIVVKRLEDKLYAHQAVQDSIIVTDTEVKGMMEERLNHDMTKLGLVGKNSTL
jgi:peptidyl-prolyl cis-trans isomerase SurA